MARPGRPERNRTARSFRQLRRFHHVINSDKVFGTHSGSDQSRLLSALAEPPLAVLADHTVISRSKSGEILISLGPRGNRSMMQRLPMQPLSVRPAFGRLLAHTDEIPRSSKCPLLTVDRQQLNNPTGEQPFETVARHAGVSRSLC